MLADEKLKNIMQGLISQGPAPAKYAVSQGRLTYKGRLGLPKGSPKIPLILQEFYDTVSGGRAGFFRTYKRISTLLFWEGMKRDIDQYVSQ